MNKKTIIATIIIVVTLVMIAQNLISVKAQNPNQINLNEGKNTIQPEQVTGIITAQQIMAQNPEIQVITTNDPITNKEIHYVNVFGGIGTNFLINPEQEYEIFTEKSLNLQL